MSASICRSVIRRFDGDKSPTLHAAAFAREAASLHFIAWLTLDKTNDRYVAPHLAPGLTFAWVPAEALSDETSSLAEIDAALADPDQIPLIVEAPGQHPTAYRSDDGGGFPTVNIKGQPMALVARVERIQPGTHGQLTFGWRTR